MTPEARAGYEVRAQELKVENFNTLSDDELKEAVELAEKNSAETKRSNAKPKTRFWRSQIAGLKVHTSPEDSVRFVPYHEKYQGDDIKVGYLTTSDKRVNELLEVDPNCSEISSDDYEKATGAGSRPAGY